MQDMEELLSLEIKKEIADRYFGSRKMIEDDSLQYNQHIREAYRLLENEVGFDLIRLYILLGQEALIHDFFRLTGLRDQVFLDPYLLHSLTIRQRLFNNLFIHGFTRRARFHNLFTDTYSRLRTGVESYSSTLKRLIDEGKALSGEIDNFHRNNDLGTMMGFLRRLGDGGMHENGPMAGDILPRHDQNLAEKMRITTPKHAEKELPAFPVLPSIASCRQKLKDLIDEAYEAQGRPEVRDFVK